MNPQEFLQHIKDFHRSMAGTSEPNLEYLAEVQRQQDLVAPDCDLRGAESGLEFAVQESYRFILQGLPDQIRQNIEGNVAIGLLENIEVNAWITKSANGVYAIVMNWGLMMLLNKFLKLVAASQNPDSVTYCNRGEPASFSSRDYMQMVGEILVHYSQTGEPRGPHIVLDYNSPSVLQVGTNLHLIESFMVGHEVGHYVNGDLDRTRPMARWELDKDVSILQMAENHEMEFAADRFAFESVLRSTALTNPVWPLGILVQGAMIMAFNFLRGINDRESVTHPAASDRMVMLANEFLGEECGQILEESFVTPTVLSTLFDRINGMSARSLAEARGLI